MTTTFNREIRSRLDKELRHTQFTPSTFNDLVEHHGVKRKYVTCTLRKFCNKGLLEIIKSTPNKTGGEPTKTYVVVDGASFEMKKSGPKKDIIRDMSSCCNALDRVTAGWVSNRCH